MTATIEDRLRQLGIELPAAPPPGGNYVSAVKSGNHLYVSGQLPTFDGRLMASGVLGRDIDVTAAARGARQCAINILGHVKTAAGDLERIRRVVKLTVFVASASDFTEPHLVANGASDFLVELLGEQGRHARSALGVATLPLGAAVEVEAIIELED